MDNMTPNAFKACFKVFINLNDNLKANCELIVGEKEKTLRSSLAKGPPTIAKEETFLHDFRNNPKIFQFWAMIKIEVDLTHKHNILAQASFSDNAWCKEKQNQRCFVKFDQQYGGKL